MNKTKAVDIVVFGVVQGVGFRPFVFRTACEQGYKGWVKNIGHGVEVHLESPRPTDFGDFLTALHRDKPPLSRIERADVREGRFHDSTEFSIQQTREQGGSFVFISPDISICENCRHEMFDPDDRRYRYPFINCTDCGPRYTIVETLPYDRGKTTMRGFPMCEDCRREYEDPMDRRYHAQPVACPRCGPKVTLIDAGTREPFRGGASETGSREPIPDDVKRAAALIQSGKILAVKGLGGFHLVCDPMNAAAVARLRAVKARSTKPLALMARDVSVVEKYARVGPDEREQLSSARRPIVLLRQREELPGIAPDLRELGFMLPYTPLHALLLQDLELIVATSSNRKDSPIMKDEEEDEEIYSLCDALLTHDRPIAMRADDSVMKLSQGQTLFVRRARGYVPYPQAVPAGFAFEGHILALGGELKDTVSVYKDGYVVTSQFLGDLDEYQNYSYFEETVRHLSSLFEIKPEAVVTDLHPDFHTTRHAQRLGLPHIQVQHHFAHVLAVLLEHGVPPDTPVLGIAWDGFGYGRDGTAWGGEFLVADYSGFERFGHFRYVGLPGGDLAARQPWRMALSYLTDIYGDALPRVEALERVEPHKIKGVREMIRQGLNTPRVSSCGRLFDAVSFLAGLAPLQVEYEAEAPMRLEAAADPACEESYPFVLARDETGEDGEDKEPRHAPPFAASFSETLRRVVDDADRNEPPGLISARFHNTLAEVIATAALHAREEKSLDTVVLSGGVFLNRTLLEKTESRLAELGFKVLRPVLYSPNDESISVGQIAFALNSLRNPG